MEHAFSEAQRYVSISQGICYDIPDADRTMKNFLQKADDLLYQVNEENRGGICIGYIRKLHKIKCNGQKSAIDTFLPVYGI